MSNTRKETLIIDRFTRKQVARFVSHVPNETKEDILKTGHLIMLREVTDMELRAELQQ